MLKSDHFGIEILIGSMYSPPLYPVKIRPFWDWNLVTAFRAHAIHLPLKSDHFGIEILYNNMLGFAGKLLKSDHFGIEILIIIVSDENAQPVKIRPFWDWNAFQVQLINSASSC